MAGIRAIERAAHQRFAGDGGLGVERVGEEGVGEEGDGKKEK